MTTFLLRCTHRACDFYYAPMTVPTYGEAHVLKLTHEWVFDGRHEMEIEEER